jgi:general secretion pathway protein H
MRIESGHRSSQEGYTLLELLVVLAILAMVLGSATTLATRHSASLDIKAAAAALAAELREARARAISKSQDALVTLDVDGREFWADGKSQHYALDRDISMELVTAAPERLTDKIGRVRYFPDGSSTGATITLALGTQRAVISVDWLTGVSKIVSP